MNRFEMIKRNLPYCLFIAYTIKCLIFGADWTVLAALPFILGLICFYEIMPKHKQFQELSNKINELEKKNLEFSDKIQQTNLTLQKNNEEVNKRLDGVRLVAGMKQMVNK